MNENANPQAAPARPPKATRLRASLGIACMVIAAAGIGYYIGSEPVPGSSAPADKCAEVQRTYGRLSTDASTAPTDDGKAGLAANVALQNPTCFNSEVRAQAQTTKDQIAARAQWGAAQRAGECADPNNWAC